MAMRACAACVLFAAPAASASIIYNHFVTSTTVVGTCNDFRTNPAETSSSVEMEGGLENSSQVAQRVTLAGTDRFVTRLDMGLVTYFTSCTTDMTAYLYTNQGGVPGSLLWSGSVTGVVLTPSPANTVVPVSFTPNIFVPESMFIAFSHENIIDQRNFMGTAVANPFFGVGQPGNWAAKDSSTGLWSDLGPSIYDFSARITAIPAPTAGWLAALGPLVLSRRRRTSRLG